MSDAQKVPTQNLPLFFSRLASVSPKLHGHLRLERGNFRFAAKVQAVPIGLTEFEIVAQHFPILFTSGANPVPVALLSLSEGHNLFVQPDGQWLKEAYIPAYVRSFPFICVEDVQTRTLVTAIEQTAEQLSPDRGQPLFEDGRPTPALNEAVAFSQAFREAATSAANFARALDAAKLLADEEATVNFTAGGSTRILGFKLVKPERLAEVDDATFLDWRRMGFLNAIYAHLHSAGRWARLIDLGAPRARPA
jgi:hypothetical protein